jgi:selenocysteine lyase/cysteine desulfurase
MGIADAEMTDLDSEVFPHMVRVSFGVYNTEQELDILIATLKEIIAKR